MLLLSCSILLHARYLVKDMMYFQALLQARLGAYVSDSDDHSDPHIVTINLVDDKDDINSKRKSVK